MNLQKNKTAIIAIVVLLVVCAGTFFGVRAMNNKLDDSTTVTTSATTTTTSGTTTTQQTTSVDNSTTAAAELPESQDSPVPSTLPVATTNSLAQISQDSSAEEIITTFPMVPTNSTTQSTSALTTAEPSTFATTRPTAAMPQVTQQTTAPTTNGSSVIDSGTLEKSGLAGYLYDPNGKYYYTSADPWQRAIGYNELFDVGAGFVSIYMDTIRFKFEYANKDWLIQFWKGQYGFLFVGHEIGVYTKPKDRTVEHYDAATENDENALFMSMTGYRKGQEIYSREYAKYWWCTGFVPGKLDNFSDRSELSLKCRITMKDQVMLDAFTKSLQQSGLVPDKDFTVSGLDVFISW